MKTLFLFAMLVLGTMSSASAQTFEHFEVKTSKASWMLRPKFDNRPTSGVNGIAAAPDKEVLEILKKLFQTFPENVKEKLKEQKVYVNLNFNSQGEIFYIIFFIVKKDDLTFLTDEQWLEIYRIIRNHKLDMTKWELVDNFEWGSWTYPISMHL